MRSSYMITAGRGGKSQFCAWAATEMVNTIELDGPMVRIKVRQLHVPLQPVPLLFKQVLCMQMIVHTISGISSYAIWHSKSVGEDLQETLETRQHEVRYWPTDQVASEVPSSYEPWQAMAAEGLKEQWPKKSLVQNLLLPWSPQTSFVLIIFFASVPLSHLQYGDNFRGKISDNPMICRQKFSRFSPWHLQWVSDKDLRQQSLCLRPCGTATSLSRQY